MTKSQVRVLAETFLGMVTEAGEPTIAEGPYSLTIGGGQPDTGAPGVTGSFVINGQLILPE
jgi:beta-glucosidase